MGLTIIGGFWKKTGKNKKYLIGKIKKDFDKNKSIYILPNSMKKEDSHPDYNACQQYDD